ncbi:TIGR00153 family protein [bacterium]|nr:TIGR00153 family protein [bacterium]MBU1919679.1 TIGR00153 family protein [bacterium]
MSILAKLLGSHAPFELLSKHLDKVMLCVDLVKPLLDAASNQNQDEVKRIAEDVFRLEHEADEIKLKIRDHLPKATLLPVSRGDLLNYLKTQDNLADNVEDLVLSVSQLRFPSCWTDGGMHDELMALADYSVSAAKEAANMLGRFERLRMIGFAGDIIEELREIANRIGQIEAKADRKQFKLVQMVLEIQDPDWHFAYSYVLLQVIRSLGKMADNAESMGDYMRLMIAD